MKEKLSREEVFELLTAKLIEQEETRRGGRIHVWHSCMDAGKSAAVIVRADNLRLHGFGVLCYMHKNHPRADELVIESRTGLKLPAEITRLFDVETFEQEVQELVDKNKRAAVLFDDMHFLSAEEAEFLIYMTDKYSLLLLCYGLSVGSFGDPWPGSARLMACAHDMQEIEVPCAFCHSKAVRHIRTDSKGAVVRSGEQLHTAKTKKAEDAAYFSVCLRHYYDLHGRP